MNIMKMNLEYLKMLVAYVIMAIAKNEIVSKWYTNKAPEVATLGLF